MKEKNWLTWLTVLALVVGFAAVGASVWLSAQAAKQTQRNSQLAGQLYQASRTSSSEASSVKKRLNKLASDNSSLRKKNSRLAKENQALKEALASRQRGRGFKCLGDGGKERQAAAGDRQPDRAGSE